MAAFRKVTLVGCGRFGSAVVPELVAAGFDTTILTRKRSNLKSVPANVSVQEVDYDSEESLHKALTGQDAVVCTIAMSALDKQKIIIDAAIKAGVKYYIPAEYTVESRHPAARALPMLAGVISIQNYLIERQHLIEWTVINCGATLEFSLDVPFIVDFERRHAAIWGNGEGRLSIGTLGLVGKAVVGVLQHPQRVQDHVVHVHNTTVSQRQVLQMAEKISSQPWTTEVKDVAKGIADSTETLTRAGPDGKGVSPTEMTTALFNMYAAMVFGDGYFEGAYSAPDNEWLGLKDVPGDEAVEKAVRYRIEKGLLGNAEGETIWDVDFV